jgi:hypothetical protein
MEAKLIVVGGKTNRGEIPLKLPTTIGRSRQATLTVAHPMISRQHCEIYERDGLLMLRDLGSLNGVLLGDKRVTEAPLPPGAEFTVGPLTLRVEYQYSGDLTALPPIQEHAETVAAAEDTASSGTVSETADIPMPQVEQVEETVPTPQPQAAESESDDMGFSFMEETQESAPASEEPLQFETPAETESQPPAEMPTTELQADDASVAESPAATVDEPVADFATAETETEEAQPPVEAEATAGEDDSPSPDTTDSRDAKKKAGGWWPFAGKGKEKEKEPKVTAKAPPTKPAPAVAAKKAPAQPAKKPAQSEPDFDDIAFEALQEESESPAPAQHSAAEKAPVKPEDMDLDSFLNGLE